jgi:uncharacterized protein YuzB (UPF0349 family)
MKTLFISGEELQAERIVKTDTDIIGYNGNDEVFSFCGISDFSQFQLAEGEVFDTDLSPEARILALEEALLMLL